MILRGTEMDDMDSMEQRLLRIKKLRPRIPFWAEAEQIEFCTLQSNKPEEEAKPVQEILPGRTRLRAEKKDGLLFRPKKIPDC